jgi:hypothetical protein
VKILFLVGATSRIRNFDQALLLLAGQGHEIRLTGRLRKGAFEIGKAIEHERISGRVNPTERSDDWRDVVDLLRGARDYVRYFDPRYAQATRLVQRASDIAPTPFVLYCERHPWVKRHWSLVARALAAGERLIPSDPGFEDFLREERPDLVVVTPLVTFESYQTDYVKAAHRLGLPIVFIPFSWDNLTNKGLMRVQPDRVLVWNDVQRTEAIDLHGCPAGKVVVTGAARFDSFFARQPSTTRAEFMNEQGLDPDRPMILYLGSSQLTGPNEMELVRRWAESIRAADDEVLRTCGILIRPHPALRNSYVSMDLSGLGDTRLSLNARRDGDQDLFDSLYHSHAAVGLNTSAMLEAAIVGTPVHTLLIPGFDSGQVGTMHFHYLVEAYGGVATAARDFAAHHRQLGGALRETGRPARRRPFVEGFLRPRGIDREVSPILAAEIARAVEIRKVPVAPPSWHGPLSRALLRWLKRRVTPADLAEDTSIIATSMSLRVVRAALLELQSGSAPVFVGPWADSATNELLYWIPFLRRTAATYALRPERLMVLTFSGDRSWYGGLAQRFLDARTLFSAPELEHWTRRSVPQSEQDPKQAVIAPFDQEVLDRAVRAFDVSEYQTLHPLSLFRVIRRVSKDLELDELGQVMQYARTTPAALDVDVPLPPSFVALSTAFTPYLPATPENEAFFQDLRAAAAGRGEPVVMVDWPARDESTPPGLTRLAIPAGATPLAVQTHVLARARKFIGGYGDLAVLAASCGTPVAAYHSVRIPPDHETRLAHAGATADWGTVTIERARRFKGGRTKVEMQAQR